MRQFSCIEVTLPDALLLRDAIRPLTRVDPFDPGTLIRFCEKLYDGILKMKSNELQTINIALEEQEALFINQFVGNEDWQSSLAILEQTWLVLYELRNKHVYPRPERPASAQDEMPADMRADAAPSGDAAPADKAAPADNDPPAGSSAGWLEPLPFPAPR